MNIQVTTHSGMPLYRSLVVTLGLIISLLSCSTGKNNYREDPGQIAGVVKEMTELMVHDVTNPPLAARFFAYSMLAGYEVVSKNDSSAPSFKTCLNKYPDIPAPSATGYYWPLAAMFAMMQTAAALQPSGKLLDMKIQALTDSCYNLGMPRQTVDSSLAYAKAISQSILAYAKTDGYRNISNYNRYAPSEKEGSWYPTPPGFFPAVEPYFNRIRSFTLDSASEFKPQPPVPYDSKPGSPFFRLAKSVYDANLALTVAQKETSSFWDCNPFALDDEGHLLIGVKKISPGAHWMGITGIVCKQQQVSFSKAMTIHTVMAVTLMDAFLCCWDEKYRSNRIRPETVIRKFIDPGWHPLLQTPPFPEYVSGHSVISTAAAEVLVHFFGDQLAFTDTVELPYGLPPRTFHSFRSAAGEAALSRFYGGIHYMDAISEGQRQGRSVGIHALQKLRLQ